MDIDETKQRARYGGFNLGAAFFGWLVATGVGVMLTALLIAAGGAVTLTSGMIALTPTVGLISGILLLAIAGISYYAGGYVAGRMSRFDGGIQGFGVWIIGVIATLVLSLLGALFGASYNLLQQINLPHIPVDQGTLTSGGVLTLLLTLVVTFLAAIVGGVAGQQYHRRVDRAGVPNRKPATSETEPAADYRYQPTFGESIDNRDIRRRKQ